MDSERSGSGSIGAHETDSTGVAPRPIDAAFFGLGSVASEDDRQAIRAMAEGLDDVCDGTIGVDHDLRIALAGGLVGEPGIVLIAGTGTSCFGRNAAGQTWRAGGWGPVLDDVGSSAWLGLQSMVATVRDFDRRGERTILTPGVLDALGIDDVNDILRLIDLQGMTRREMGELAKLVTKAASDDDAVAKSIISAGVRELAAMIATVARELQLSPSLGEVPVAVTGGLRKAGEVFLEPLRAAVAHAAPTCRIVQPKLPPVVGAALIALESMGIALDEKVINNIQVSRRDLQQQ